MLVSLASHIAMICKIPKDTDESRISWIIEMTYLVQAVPASEP